MNKNIVRIGAVLGAVIVMILLFTVVGQSSNSQPTAQPQTQNETQASAPKTSFSDGIYVVGTEIKPGTYKTTTESSCFYARLSGFSGELEDTIINANHDPGKDLVLTIEATDKGFETDGCGTWQLVK